MNNSNNGNNLFENTKYCSVCHCPLPENYDKERCASCEENELFNEVREYIRSKNVNEYQVAEEFGIPLGKIRGWIKEGRIEYKKLERGTLQQLKCAECGKPIQFGTYCQRCFKLKNTPKLGYVKKEKSKDNKMRFLE